jgi:hypothetical protein
VGLAINCGPEGLAGRRWTWPPMDLRTTVIATPSQLVWCTVQTHLTHVYTKLGLSSRMQLAQEAARHA